MLWISGQSVATQLNRGLSGQRPDFFFYNNQISDEF